MAEIANEPQRTKHETKTIVIFAGNFTEWAVANSDKFPPRGPNRNRQNSRCVNCHERGHRVHDCPQPAKKVVCYMCGQEGHFEPRCPNKICLKVTLSPIAAPNFGIFTFTLFSRNSAVNGREPSNSDARNANKKHKCNALFVVCVDTKLLNAQTSGDATIQR